MSLGVSSFLPFLPFVTIPTIPVRSMSSTEWTSCRAFVLGSGVRDPLQPIEFRVHSLPGGLASAPTTLKRAGQTAHLPRGWFSLQLAVCVLTLPYCTRRDWTQSHGQMSSPQRVDYHATRFSAAELCHLIPFRTNDRGVTAKDGGTSRPGCTARTKWVEPLGNEGWV